MGRRCGCTRCPPDRPAWHGPLRQALDMEFHAAVPHEPVELLFLHPLPFDGEIWRPLAARFGSLVAHAPTMYPLGESLEAVARAVLDLTGGGRLIVIGNSIGGSVALEVASAAPDRVEHLVLIGTKAGHRPEPHYRDWALDLLASDGVGAAWDQIWEPLFGPATRRSVVEEARGRALAMPPDVLAAGIVLFHSRRDLGHVIDEWPQPITVVAGSHDGAPRRQVAEEMVGRAQRGVLEVVPNCGHYVPMEQPAALAAILDRVIESTERPAG